MIPILYSASETAFTSNGIGRLADAIECSVTEERNGIYELYLKYPITGVHFSDIQHSRIIAAVPADGKAIQPFRIYKIAKPIDGICEIYAEHISYELNHIPVMPFKAGSCVDALNKLVTFSAQDNPFSVWTDKTVTGNYNLTRPTSFRALLGGVEGSILDVYGTGEYEFDKYLVKLYLHRGYNTGVTIRYAKNLVDLMQEESIEETITGVCPYWEDFETGKVVTLPEKAIYASTVNNFPFKRTAVVDFTEDFETAPTVAQLRQRAQKYIEDNDIGVPKINLDVKFVPLWQTNGVSVGTPTPTLVLDSGNVSGDTLLNVDGEVYSSAASGATFTDNNGNVVMASDSITATEDGSGNVTIPANQVLTFLDDGEGNIIISGVDSTASLEMAAHWEITYQDYRVLERVNLCDTVTVLYDELGVSATMEVIKTDYNVLLDRYNDIELGDPKSTLASTITNIEREINQKVATQSSSIRNWVDHQTSLITGGLGGYVRFTYNANGEPQEILIMDTDDPTTAVNVIRMNKNGIGFSTTGYNGPFTSAWTIDGVFNTDFISAGSIEGNKIKAGSLYADLLHLYGMMSVYTDAASNNIGGYIGHGTAVTTVNGELIRTPAMFLRSANWESIVMVSDAGVRIGRSTYNSETDSYEQSGVYFVDTGFFVETDELVKGNLYVGPNASDLRISAYHGDYGGTIRIRDSGGTAKALLFVNATQNDERGGLQLFGKGGNIQVSAYPTDYGAELRLSDSSGVVKARFAVNNAQGSEGGIMQLNRPDGSSSVLAATSTYGGGVNINDNSGTTKARLYVNNVSGNRIGVLTLCDEAGNEYNLTPSLINKLINL